VSEVDEEDTGQASGRVVRAVTACVGMAALYIIGFVMAFFAGIWVGIAVLGYRLVTGG
jgi:hypothetical protein